jgi:hypothetical protein
MPELVSKNKSHHFALIIESNLFCKILPTLYRIKMVALDIILLRAYVLGNSKRESFVTNVVFAYTADDTVWFVTGSLEWVLADTRVVMSAMSYLELDGSQSPNVILGGKVIDEIHYIRKDPCLVLYNHSASLSASPSIDNHILLLLALEQLHGIQVRIPVVQDLPVEHINKVTFTFGRVSTSI